MSVLYRSFLGMLFVLTVSSFASPSGGFSRFYTIEDERYKIAVTEKKLLECPRWDPENDANPPVGAAEALKKAKQWAEGYDLPKNKHFQFDSLNLFKASHAWDFEHKFPKSARDLWIWRVEYRVHNYGALGDTVDKIECWILMDGTVVEPKLQRKLKEE